MRPPNEQPCLQPVINRYVQPGWHRTKLETKTASCFPASGGKRGSQIKDLDFLQISVGHTEKFKERKCSEKWAENQPVTLSFAPARPQTIPPAPVRTSGPGKFILHSH